MKKPEQLGLRIVVHAHYGPMPDEATAIFNFVYHCFGYMLNEFDIERVWEMSEGRLQLHIRHPRRSPTQSELRRAARGYLECRQAGYGL